MKMINKEGKVFNKINILDLLFVAAIAFLIFLSVVKIMGKDLDDISLDSQIRTIEAEVSVVMDKGYLDTIRIGDRLGETKQHLDAYVESVEIEPVKVTNVDSDGNPVVSVDPLKEKAKVVFKATIPFESNSYKLGKQELRQGKIIFLESDFYRYFAQIESIKVVD
jgi:hypothetical protein